MKNSKAMGIGCLAIVGPIVLLALLGYLFGAAEKSGSAGEGYDSLAVVSSTARLRHEIDSTKTAQANTVVSREDSIWQNSTDPLFATMQQIPTNSDSIFRKSSIVAMNEMLKIRDKMRLRAEPYIQGLIPDHEFDYGMKTLRWRAITLYDRVSEARHDAPRASFFFHMEVCQLGTATKMLFRDYPDGSSLENRERQKAMLLIYLDEFDDALDGVKLYADSLHIDLGIE